MALRVQRYEQMTCLSGKKVGRQAGPNTHRYIRNFEGFVLNGQGVARAAIQLKKAGFVPDVVCAHPSWGESLFVKDVFPDARLLLFCEFYYRAIGAEGYYGAYTVNAHTDLAIIPESTTVIAPSSVTMLALALWPPTSSA